MMEKKLKVRLKLNKETLRFLEASELKQVDGGYPSIAGTCGTCPIAYCHLT
jgi:hypothetical protein